MDDVPDAFARLVREECAAVLARREDGRPFRLGCSGGQSGRACFERLAREPLPWSRVACYFADERCVEPTSPDANAELVRRSLGAHVGELAGFHPMSCEAGPAAYEALLRAHGLPDLLQLGLGPDGHTASLFPGSAGLDAPPERLVVANEDPSGTNRFSRLSLTLGAIARCGLVVFTVIEPSRAPALAAVAGGEDLPAARVSAHRVVWLVSAEAAAGLHTAAGR